LTQAVEIFFDLARLRRSPADLPTSQPLLMATLVAYVILGVVLFMIAPPKFGHAVVFVALELGISLLGLAIFLRLARHPERYLQTATASLGATLGLAPVLLIAAWLVRSQQQNEAALSMVTALRLGIELYAYVVLIRIVKLATEWPWVAAIGAVFTLDLLTFMAVVTLYPEAMPAPAPAPAA
jgi:hypothetical protein